MDEGYRNSEGYPDPTPYEAFLNIGKERKRRFMPVVYICSPYRGDVEDNVRNARAWSRFAVRNGCIPVAPHLLFTQFMDDGDAGERTLALFMGQVLLSKCAEVWVFGSRITEGMKGEIEFAERKGKKIRMFTSECMEVTDEERRLEG